MVPFLRDGDLDNEISAKGLYIRCYFAFFHAERAIVFSCLHPEAAKEINLVNPVNHDRKYY